MHACYNAYMNTTQYTIRNIPADVDRVIRKKAKISGRSINQVIIDDMRQVNGLSAKAKLGGALAGLEWFVGAGAIDDATLKALEEDDKAQKSLAERENKKLEDLFK